MGKFEKRKMTSDIGKHPKRRKKENINVTSGEMIDLGRLKLPTLKRYKQSHESYFSQFNAETLKNRNELIETINNHFRNKYGTAE